VDGRAARAEKAHLSARGGAALGAIVVAAALTACASRPPRSPSAGAPADSSSAAGTAHGSSHESSPGSPPSGEPPTIAVTPLHGWPRWLGDANHQISGLAYRDGHLYAVSDQSGVETRALLEIELPSNEGVVPPGESVPPSPADLGRAVGVRVRCRWQGGPHPDAEGMALDPMTGPPQSVLLALETHADALIEIGFDDCALRSQVAPLTGSDSNEGIEGIALSPDGVTVYLVHETRTRLFSMPRAGPGPAREIARIAGARSLCDAAYDDRGTATTDDDRLLLLDRNARRILDVTLQGRVAGVWDLDPEVARDPDGIPYSLVALEALALEAREPDGSLLVYAATDTPPRPFPYSRRGKDDDAGRYERRVGMLYRFRLPPFP